MKPTSEILERIYKNASDHKDGVYTRLYREKISTLLFIKSFIPIKVQLPKA